MANKVKIFNKMFLLTSVKINLNILEIEESQEFLLEIDKIIVIRIVAVIHVFGTELTFPHSMLILN